MGGMFSKPKVPKMETPKVVPMVDEDALAASRRRTQGAARKRSGRQGTILTDNNDTLG